MSFTYHFMLTVRLLIFRRFVYEFNVVYAKPSSSAEVSTELACIQVPFKTIEALSCQDNAIVVYVNSKPRMYGSLKQASYGILSSPHVFNTKKEVDSTYGQLASSATHKVSSYHSAVHQCIYVYG